MFRVIRAISEFFWKNDRGWKVETAPSFSFSLLVQWSPLPALWVHWKVPSPSWVVGFCHLPPICSVLLFHLRFRLLSGLLGLLHWPRFVCLQFVVRNAPREALLHSHCRSAPLGSLTPPNLIRSQIQVWEAGFRILQQLRRCSALLSGKENTQFVNEWQTRTVTNFLEWNCCSQIGFCLNSPFFSGNPALLSRCWWQPPDLLAPWPRRWPSYDCPFFHFLPQFEWQESFANGLSGRSLHSGDWHTTVEEDFFPKSWTCCAFGWFKMLYQNRLNGFL